MKRQTILSRGIGVSSTHAAFAFALSALGAGFLACSGEFQYAECPAGTEQNGGGDVSEACKPLGGSGGSGGSGGATGTGGAGGLSGFSGSGGASGSAGQGGGGASGAAGVGGGGAGGGVVPGPAGTLDASFGKGGKADFGALTITGLSAFDFQSTEKLVATGQASFSDGTRKSLVLRLDTVGALDTTFGGGKGYGVDSNNYGSSPVEYLERLAVLGGDKILALPARQLSCNLATCRSVRFLADGAIDVSHQSFPIGGSLGRLVDLSRAPGGQYYLLTTDVGSDVSLSISVRAEDTDENLHYAWLSYVNGPPTTDPVKVARRAPVDAQGRVNVAYAIERETFFGVTRVSADGKEDSNFAFFGKHEQGAGEPLGLALDTSGRLLVAGDAASAAVVGRVTTTGALDTTFGNAGVTPSVPSTRWECVVADEGERAVVVGTYDGGDSQAIRLGRYGQNGFPDVTYGVEGSGFATLAQGAEVSVSMCKLDKQGRLLVAGAVRESAGAPLAPFLARVWN